MKIVGNTVGTSLPKPNLMQDNPKKGDFVKGKDEFRKRTGVNIPGGAKVGQAIVVQAVDENGNPTEWEATDIPESTGGASVTFFATYGVTKYTEIDDAFNAGKFIYVNCHNQMTYVRFSNKEGERYDFNGINRYGVFVSVKLYSDDTWEVETASINMDWM